MGEAQSVAPGENSLKIGKKISTKNNFWKNSDHQVLKIKSMVKILQIFCRKEAVDCDFGKRIFVSSFGGK